MRVKVYLGAEAEIEVDNKFKELDIPIDEHPIINEELYTDLMNCAAENILKNDKIRLKKISLNSICSTKTGNVMAEW